MIVNEQTRAVIVNARAAADAYLRAWLELARENSLETFSPKSKAPWDIAHRKRVLAKQAGLIAAMVDWQVAYEEVYEEDGADFTQAELTHAVYRVLRPPLLFEGEPVKPTDHNALYLASVLSAAAEDYYRDTKDEPNQAAKISALNYIAKHKFIRNRRTVRTLLTTTDNVTKDQ